MRCCNFFFTSPACKAHALYCQMWPVWLNHIFGHYLINGTIFGSMLLNIKCVFCFSLQLLSETFLILIRIERQIDINVKTPSSKVPVIPLGSEWNLNFLDRFSKKKKKLKFEQNPSSGRGAVPCRRTGMTKLIVAFRNLANASKNITVATSYFYLLPTEAGSYGNAIVLYKMPTTNCNKR
jgi:hypothetical protein